MSEHNIADDGYCWRCRRSPCFNPTIADLREQLRVAGDVTRDALAMIADLTARLAEYERLHAELNAALHPNGDGPSAPSLCDLVAYAAGDQERLALAQEVLTEVEWAGPRSASPCCPICFAHSRHEPDCRLAKAEG